MTTPLYFACKQLRGEIAENVIKLLLDFGANPNTEFTDKDSIFSWRYWQEEKTITPFLVACRYQSKEVIQIMLDSGANVNTNIELIDNEYNDIEGDGPTPLTIACEERDYSLIELLVDRGALVDARNNHGDKPILIACNRRDLQTVKLLADAGANLKELDFSGFDIVMNACFNDECGEEIVRCLVIEKGISPDYYSRTTRNEGPLHIACRYQKPGTIKFIFDSTRYVNEENYNMSTPICFACKYQPLEVIKHFFENGLRVGSNRVNLINIARKRKNQEIVDYLLEIGEKDEGENFYSD